MLPQYGENRLLHEARLAGSKGPLSQGGKLMAEERIRVGQRLLDGTGYRLLQDGTAIRTAGPSKERIDGLARIACPV